MSAASPPSPLRVFPDTGALLAMLLFPRDREGNLTLAGEVLEKMPLSLPPQWSRNRTSSSPMTFGPSIPLRPNASGPGIRSQ